MCQLIVNSYRLLFLKLDKLKIHFMETLKMYKEMDIKFYEFDAAMIQLGFLKSSDDQFLVYKHEKSGSKIFLSQYHKALEHLNKGWFIANCSNLEGLGVIEHRNDLAKLIEQMRLEARNSVV
jgi:hypothetical protein